MNEAYTVTKFAFAQDAAALSEEDPIEAAELVANGEPSGMYDDEEGRTGVGVYLSDLERETYDDGTPSLPPLSCPEPGGLLVVRQVEAWMGEYKELVGRTHMFAHDYHVREYWEQQAHVVMTKVLAAQQVLGLLNIHVLWPIDD